MHHLANGDAAKSTDFGGCVTGIGRHCAFCTVYCCRLALPSFSSRGILGLGVVPAVLGGVRFIAYGAFLAFTFLSFSFGILTFLFRFSFVFPFFVALRPLVCVPTFSCVVLSASFASYRLV